MLKSVSRIVGLVLVICGLWLSVYFFAFFDISVEAPRVEILGTVVGGGRVANLSKMDERQNGIIFGFGAALVGGILIFLGRDTSRVLAGDERKCPFCAEYIKADATICRYCHKELSTQSRILT